MNRNHRLWSIIAVVFYFISPFAYGETTFPLNLQSTGEMKVEGINLAFQFQAGSVVTARDLEVDVGYPKQTDDLWETRGSVKLATGQKLRVEQQIRRQGEGVFAIEQHFSCDTDVAVESVALVATLPADEFAGKELLYNGQAEALPVKANEKVVHWKSNLESVGIPVANGVLQFKGEIASRVADERTWNLPQFGLRIMGTPGKGKLKESVIAVTLSLPSDSAKPATPVDKAPATDSDFAPKDDGTFAISGIPFNLLLQGENGKGVRSFNDMKNDDGYPKKSEDNWETRGTLSLEEGASAKVIEQVKKGQDGRYEVTLTVQSDKELSPETLALVASLPTTKYAGTLISYNDVPETLPASPKGVIVGWKSNISSVEIPTTTGAVKLEGNLSLCIADARKWGGQQFGLRLLMNREGASKEGFKKATLTFTIARISSNK